MEVFIFYQVLISLSLIGSNYKQTFFKMDNFMEIFDCLNSSRNEM